MRVLARSAMARRRSPVTATRACVGGRAAGSQGVGDGSIVGHAAFRASRRVHRHHRHVDVGQDLRVVRVRTTATEAFIGSRFGGVDADIDTWIRSSSLMPTHRLRQLLQLAEAQAPARGSRNACSASWAWRRAGRPTRASMRRCGSWPASVEHLPARGHLGHVGHLDAGLADGPGGAAGNQLEAAFGQAVSQVEQPALVERGAAPAGASIGRRARITAITAACVDQAIRGR